MMSNAKHGLRMFEIPIEVQQRDIDDNDHVNNVVYLQWIFDVALAHWNASAPPEMRETYAWVATRHEIDYRREALMGDAIVARTWIGGVDSRKFERLTEIVRTRDEQVLARGTSYWALIARATGRITRIPPEMVTLFEAYMVVGADASRAVARSASTSA
jgi:acyl-CoA thioester hydrolase